MADRSDDGRHDLYGPFMSWAPHPTTSIPIADPSVSSSRERLRALTRIETPRLYLRPLARADAELVVGWRNEPANADMFLLPPPTLEQHLAWFDAPRVGRIDWVIVDRARDVPIGTLNYKRFDDASGSAETGTLLGDTASRGKGFAREAKAAWMLYGFAALGLERVEVVMRADNAAIIHINTVLGCLPDGVVELPNAAGIPMPFMRMALTRDGVLCRSLYAAADLHGFLGVIAPRS